MEAFVVFTREETSDPHALATYSAGVGPSFDGHDVTRRLWRDPAFGGAAHRRGRNLAFPDDAGRSRLV